MPHFPTSGFPNSFLGQFQNFPKNLAICTPTARTFINHPQRSWLQPSDPRPRARLSSRTNAPPSGWQSEHRHPFDKPFSQGLLEGTEALSTGLGLDPRPIRVCSPSCLLPKAIPLFVLLPPSHCWLCFLVPHEYFSVCRSGCGLLSTALIQRAKRWSTERSLPFL